MMSSRARECGSLRYSDRALIGEETVQLIELRIACSHSHHYAKSDRQGIVVLTHCWLPIQRRTTGLGQSNAFALRLPRAL